MMTISKQRVAIITIAFLTFAAVVSTILNLITSGNRNDDVPSSSSNFGNSNTAKIRSRTWPKSKSSRDLSSILPRDIGEVPIDIQESVDPHLIDFVVGGFPKCGTTYLQNKILYPSERLFIPHHETHFLQNDKYSEFVAEFDNVTKSSMSDEANNSDNVDADSGQKEMVVGYKAPFELGHERSLRNLETLFPDVDIIITLRHPVLQFESLYNYKLRKYPSLIPTVENFIGVCGELCPEYSNNVNDNDNDDDDDDNDERRETSAIVSTATEQVKKNFDNEDGFRSFLSSTKDTSRVSEFNAKKVTKKVTRIEQRCVSDTDITFCTGESNYHMYLSRLGLTPMDTPEELALLDHHDMPIHDFSAKGDDSVDGDDDKAKLFLIEIGQFDHRKNQTMADDVITDLETFLGLDVGDLPRTPHRTDERTKTVYDYPEDRKGQILDICLERYEPLREILLETSRNASKWIIDYLLRPSNRGRVVVSNIDMFISMVEEWKIDPCLE
jgi:hypothetical protein